MGKRRGAADAVGCGVSEDAGGDARAGQPRCVASLGWGWGEEQLQLTKGKRGNENQCLGCPWCYSSIIQQLGNERKEKKHKGKAKEELLEAGRKKQKSYMAKWHLINVWAGSIGWEVIVLIMVKSGSFLSVRLCRFLEIGGVT